MMRGGRGVRTAKLRSAMCGGFFCLLVATGCSEGVHWTVGTYDDAHAQAVAAHQATFVYFRNWYLTECTEFEEKVLKQPDVLNETRTMVCVPLSFDWDRPLAQQWRLAAPPAIAIVAPDGTVLARDDAPITAADLLAEMRAAKAKLGNGGATPSTSAAKP